uniref:NADH dehydrogenase subunit 6 n=1 Tax=Amphionides reynaudii TaxID=1727191 RepID=UPI0021D53A40|nr:NADH dehydrogenase subunit 6 [Amphionides reynaudii]UXG18833.1 NADH dehydrogenase subunit 6 [Amphionides reynaudii]
MSTLFILSYFATVTAFFFTRMDHPLAMGLTILIQTILVCLISGLLSKHMWFSYILFLIFLGAMLVLFIYVASLASNEPFYISINYLLTLIFFMIIVPMFSFLDPLLSTLKSCIQSSFISNIEFTNSVYYNLSVIYNPSAASLTLFVIMYLLLTLIVVVKITSTFFGPLRLVS